MSQITEYPLKFPVWVAVFLQDHEEGSHTEDEWCVTNNAGTYTLVCGYRGPIADFASEDEAREAIDAARELPREILAEYALRETESGVRISTALA